MSTGKEGVLKELRPLLLNQNLSTEQRAAILGAIKIIKKVDGFDVIHAAVVTQSLLLNEFFASLRFACSDTQLDVQLSYMADKLNPNSMEIIKELTEYIKLKEKVNNNGALSNAIS